MCQKSANTLIKIYILQPWPTSGPSYHLLHSKCQSSPCWTCWDPDSWDAIWKNTDTIFSKAERLDLISNVIVSNIVSRVSREGLTKSVMFTIYTQQEIEDRRRFFLVKATSHFIHLFYSTKTVWTWKKCQCKRNFDSKSQMQQHEFQHEQNKKKRRKEKKPQGDSVAPNEKESYISPVKECSKLWWDVRGDSFPLSEY